MDWLKLLFKDPATSAAVLASGVVGFVVALANGVVKKRHDGWAGFFGAVVTGTVVALMVGLGTSDYVRSETLRLCIVGVCTVISDDILAGLKALGGGIRTDPLGAVIRIFDALRGRESSTPPKE